MIYPSSTTNQRDWYCNWDKGSKRTFGFGPAGSTESELIFRGDGKYTIYGASDPTYSGQMLVTGSTPRIYVRNTTLENGNTVLPPPAETWNDVEITFYCNTTNSGQNISYAGIEAVARTNHDPDTALCSTRGYGFKINFDGRCQFEKETCHPDVKQTSNVYPFGKGTRMPLNKWIGMKSVARACDNNTKVQQEIWMDMTDGLNGGTWVKLYEFTDYQNWSSDAPFCCSYHRGQVLLPPYMLTNYTVYLRTDGLVVQGRQYYKFFSIRQIDPLP